MLFLPVPEISNNIGKNNDGVAIGNINESLLTSAYTDIRLAAIIYAYRKDVSGTNFIFTDISTLLTSGTGVDIFGDITAMGAGDEALLACDDDIKEIYVEVLTSGVYVSSGLQFNYSDNGINTNMEYTGIVDTSNGFRNAPGIYKISGFTNNLVSFTPVHGSITSREWISFKPKNLGVITTVPRLGRIWIVHHDEHITYRDITNTTNANITDNVFTGIPALFYTEGASVLYIMSNIPFGFEHYVFRAISPMRTTVWEYLASDDTWKTIIGFNDPSNSFQNGPAVLGTTSTKYSVRMTTPSDMVTKTLTLPTSTNPANIVTGMIIRMRITAITTYGNTNPPLYRTRVKQPGVNNAYGIYHSLSKTYKNISFEIGVPSTQITSFQLMNMRNGSATTVTVPANTSHSGELTNENIDLIPDLTIPAGHGLGLIHTSGGKLQDIKLYLGE